MENDEAEELEQTLPDDKCPKMGRHFYLPDPEEPVLICAHCNKEQEPLDILMFVGAKFYTVQSFLEEAIRLGASKRIRRYPDFCLPGVSKVFLAYQDSLPLEQRGKDKSEQTPPEERSMVFGYFTIDRVEVIVEDPSKLDEEAQKRGIIAVSKKEAAKEPPRGCGQRFSGAYYLMSVIDPEALEMLKKEMADLSDLKGAMSTFKPPIKFQSRQFRGYKYVWGDQIIRGTSQTGWEVFAPNQDQYRRNRVNRSVKSLLKMLETV